MGINKKEENLSTNGTQASIGGHVCSMPLVPGDSIKVDGDQESVNCIGSSETGQPDAEKTPLYSELKEELVPSKPIYEARALNCSQNSNIIESSNVCGINIFTRNSHEVPGVTQDHRSYDQRDLADMVLSAVLSHKATNKRSFPLRLFRNQAKYHEFKLDKRLTKLPQPVQVKLNQIVRSRKTSISNLWYERNWTIVMMREQYNYHLARAKDEEVKKGMLRSLRKGAGRGRPIDNFFILRGHKSVGRDEKLVTAAEGFLKTPIRANEVEQEGRVKSSEQGTFDFVSKNQQAQPLSQCPSQSHCGIENITTTATTNGQFLEPDHYGPSLGDGASFVNLEPPFPSPPYSGGSSLFQPMAFTSSLTLGSPIIQPESTIPAPDSADQQASAYGAEPADLFLLSSLPDQMYVHLSAYVREDTQTPVYAARSASPMTLAGWSRRGAHPSDNNNLLGDDGGISADYSELRQAYRNFAYPHSSACGSPPNVDTLLTDSDLPLPSHETPLGSILAAPTAFSDVENYSAGSGPSIDVEGSKITMLPDEPLQGSGETGRGVVDI